MQNKKTRKFLSMLLVICMLFTIMPVGAFAATDLLEPPEELEMVEVSAPDSSKAMTAQLSFRGTPEQIDQYLQNVIKTRTITVGTDKVTFSPNSKGLPAGATNSFAVLSENGKYTKIAFSTDLFKKSEANVKVATIKAAGYEDLSVSIKNQKVVPKNRDVTVTITEKKYNPDGGYAGAVDFAPQVVRVPVGDTHLTAENISTILSDPQFAGYKECNNKVKIDKDKATLHIEKNRAKINTTVMYREYDALGQAKEDTKLKDLELTVPQNNYPEKKGVLGDGEKEYILNTLNKTAGVEYTWAKDSSFDVTDMKATLTVIDRVSPVSISLIDSKTNKAVGEPLTLQVPVASNRLDSVADMEVWAEANLPEGYTLLPRANQNYNISATEGNRTAVLKMEPLPIVKVQYKEGKKVVGESFTIYVPKGTTTLADNEEAKTKINANKPDKYVLAKNVNYKINADNVVNIAVEKERKTITILYVPEGQTEAKKTITHSVLVDAETINATNKKLATQVPENYEQVDKNAVYPISADNKVIVPVKLQERDVTIKFEVYDEDGNPTGIYPIDSETMSIVVTLDSIHRDTVDDFIPDYGLNEDKYVLFYPAQTVYPIVADTVTVPLLKTTHTIQVFYQDVADSNILNPNEPVDYTVEKAQTALNDADLEYLKPDIFGYEPAKGAAVITIANTVNYPLQKVYGDVSVVYVDENDQVVSSEKPVVFSDVALLTEAITDEKAIATVAGNVPYGYLLGGTQDYTIDWNKAPNGVITVKVLSNHAVVEIAAEPGEAVGDFTAKDKIIAFEEGKTIFVPKAEDLYTIDPKWELVGIKATGFSNEDVDEGDLIALKGDKQSLRYMFALKEVKPVTHQIPVTISPEAGVTDKVTEATASLVENKDHKVTIQNPANYFKIADGFEVEDVLIAGFDGNDKKVSVKVGHEATVTGANPTIHYVLKDVRPVTVKVALNASPDVAIDGKNAVTANLEVAKDGTVRVPKDSDYFKVNKDFELVKITVNGFDISSTDKDITINQSLTPAGKDLSINYIYAPKAPVSESIGLIATPSEAMAGSAAMTKDLALDSNGFITVPAADKYFTAKKDYKFVKVFAYGFNGSADGQEVKVGDKLKVTHKDPILKYFYEAVETTVPVNFIAGPNGAVKGTGVLEKELVVGKDGTVVVPKDTTIYSVNDGYVLDAIMATGFNGTDVAFEVKAGTALKATSKHPVLKYLYKATGTSQEVVMTIGSNQIVVDGDVEYIDTAAVIKDSRTFVPFRALAEAFGADVQYVEANRTVIAKLDGTTVIMTVGSNVYTVNGVRHTMDVAPYISNSRVMVPVRFMAEAFGITVTPTFNAVDGTTASVIFTK